jgi:hypothetical protein
VLQSCLHLVFFAQSRVGDFFRRAQLMLVNDVLDLGGGCGGVVFGL